MKVAILGSGPILQTLTQQHIDSYNLVICINRAILRYLEVAGHFIEAEKVVWAALDVHYMKATREDNPKLASIKILTLASRALEGRLDADRLLGVVKGPSGELCNATADLDALERKDGLFTVTHALTYAKSLKPKRIDLWVDWKGEKDFNGTIPKDVSRNENRWERERAQVSELLEANVNFYSELNAI